MTLIIDSWLREFFGCFTWHKSSENSAKINQHSMLLIVVSQNRSPCLIICCNHLCNGVKKCRRYSGRGIIDVEPFNFLGCATKTNVKLKVKVILYWIWMLFSKWFAQSFSQHVAEVAFVIFVYFSVRANFNSRGEKYECSLHFFCKGANLECDVKHGLW